MNLLDTLKNVQTKRAEAPIPGQAANLRQMLASKSGKAGATTGPAMSNIQEQSAIQDFNTAATQQQKAGVLDAGQQELQRQSQVEQRAQAQRQLSDQSAKSQMEYDQGMTTIANKLDRLKDHLDSQEGRDALAEAVIARRFADKKYMTELGRQGTLRRLDNQQDFEIEAANTAFGNWKELFTNQSDFAKIMRMDDAEFKKNLARMNINHANSILNSQMEANNRASVYESYGELGSTAWNTINKERSYTESVEGPDGKMQNVERKSSLLQDWMSD
jgi:hypothetical protein